MASRDSDSWLWVSLAILGYFGSLAIHRQLVAIRQSSQVTRHDRRPNMSKQTEDALKLKALGDLTWSPDPDIRAASVKIITDRAVREGPAWDMMMRDIAGTNMERRDKALACLRFLCSSKSFDPQAETAIGCYPTYKAIVDCLCNLLPEAHIAEKKDSAFRTRPERDAINFLYQILSFDVAKAIKAGVISRWLAQYPFGGADASRYKRSNTILCLLDINPDYEDSEYRLIMCRMLLHMSKTPSLRKELVEHGLLDVPKGNEISFDNEWDMPEAPLRTYLQPNRARRGVPSGTSNRPREESFEEQALRRRRREVMVLGEVGRPIERADIIERESTALDGFRATASLADEVEVELEQPLATVADEYLEGELELLREEILRAESGRDGGWWSWLTRVRPDGLAR